MDYKIIATDASIGQIQVAYEKDGKFIATYAIDVPIVDGVFITGDVLDAEIKHRAPNWLTQREQDVAQAGNFSEIEALIQQPIVTQGDPETIENAQMWQQIHFEKQVAAVLVKLGILEEDPTEIPVTGL
jgi:hypothetical protein